jgi:hypothetical protein
MDDLTFLRSNRALLTADLGHGADLLGGSRTALLQPLAGEQNVRQADQQTGRHPERPAEGPHHRREGERDTGAVQMPKVLDIASTTTK